MTTPETKRTNRDLAELAVERALEVAVAEIGRRPPVTLEVATKRGQAASEVFIEQIDNAPPAFPPGVVELATEWVAYSGRFGVVAEIHNGVYDNEHCARLALAIVEMDRELSQRASKR